jgi:glycosyltransferase involved in cell wall biosynthesis
VKVLLQSRTTLFTVPGGDTIQVVKTAEALRATGCSVDISLKLEPDVSSYDLVHLFNLTRPQEVFVQATNAMKQGKNVVLSTIYADFNEYDRFGRGGIAGMISRIVSPGTIGYLKVVARAVKNREFNKGVRVLIVNGFRRLQSMLLDSCSVLLPNSESEMKRIRSHFPQAGNNRYLVVPNGIDSAIFDADNVGIGSLANIYEGCVLSVARIEGLKNQLNLVRAMKGLPWPLVLIGKPAPNHQSYYEQVKIEAGSNVHIIGEIDHTMLPHFYKAARVHVLASWMETTGLSSLEAAAMGCNIVITDRGDTRDYFADYAFYCKPDSVESLRAAIIKAYDAPVDPQLRHRILDKFTWSKAAEKTLEGYRMALNTGKSK